MADNSPVHLAIDLGASGGRVLAGMIGDKGIDLVPIHRFANGGVSLGNRLVWNLLGQWQEIQAGLAQAASRFGDRIQSVGADTWGVDYVLLDRNDDQVGPCFHYRDARTNGMMERAEELVGKSKIFSETGLQFIQINTLYQLLAMREQGSPLLDIADRFLMVPDYLHWQLTGQKVNEFTNSSTTQLLSPATGKWSSDLLSALNLPAGIFQDPVQPGERLGKLTQSVLTQTGLPASVQAILPATHDTGSAVLAVPASSFAEEKPDWCYISCGTWSLMGAELAAPNLTEDCLKYNFTNEGGVAGSVRLLKNISGLWVVQQCREQWKKEGRELSWQRLTQLAEEAPSMRALIDPDDTRFVAPANMVEAIQVYCQQSGQVVPQTEGEVIRCALESLVLRYRKVLDDLQTLVGREMTTIHMVGGGVQNQMLCQLTADACGKVVVAGPVEATAIGNVMMQAIGSGELGSVLEGRELVRKASDIVRYEPRCQPSWDEGFQRFQSLADRSFESP